MKSWSLHCWRGALAAAGALTLSLTLTACDNSPWPTGAEKQNTSYSAVVGSSPRHLDPTASYWANDTPYTYQIYEPPYGYHYLKRPFELVPKTAAEIAVPRYYDKAGKELPHDARADLIAESVYDIKIKPGVMFQPHPAFAKDAQGKHLYHSLKRGDLGERTTPLEFEHQGTRELEAEDFVYALKRHTTTRVTTPVFGVFAEYVLGLAEYGKLVKAEDAKLRKSRNPADPDKPFLDFRKWPLEGATAPEKHLLRIRIKGKYPQWNYWMAMTFLAPIPWEADSFYAQPGMVAAGMSMESWPIGTGPYMMVEFIKDRRHVMKRNPNYRGDVYPCEGGPGDKEAGLLDDCGKKLPFIDTYVSTVEREAVPQKGKFKQGFYDLEVFERTDTGLDYLIGMQDTPSLRQEYEEKGFRLEKFADVQSWVFGFNMIDPVIGWGNTPEQRAKNRKLRQAFSIALDWEEFSKVFPKAAGEVAMGPLPSGIFGSRHNQPGDINPVTHRMVNGKLERRPIEDAKKLMAEAGYPNGRDAKTGRPLVVNYDFPSALTPERKPQVDWTVRQFAKIDVQLEVRATDNNQFQDKVRKGNHQLFNLGWLADYPDAENFMFLLHGPNAKARSDGENTANYQNPEYDKLFNEMKSLDDGPQKQAVIDKMVKIVQDDAPWSFGYFPFSSAAVQSWVYNSKPAVMIRDHGKYLRINIDERAKKQHAWNRPVWWPLVLILLTLAAAIWGVRHMMNIRERTNARGEVI